VTRTRTAARLDLNDEALLIAVANTGHGDGDEFADADATATWWRGLGAPTPTVRENFSADGLAMLRTLRAVIRRLALRNNGIDTDVDTTALDGFALRPDLTGNPSLRPETVGDHSHAICTATVVALLRASARPGWPRLKACRGADCRWVFIDGSRNTSRRWCDMAACGNRAKGESFRARHRTLEVSVD
jgi:predicted RNA-binding Zn ribbon-like protein